MKNTLLTLICAVAATTALSQSDPTSSRTLTLAPDDAPSSGGGGVGGDDEKAKAAALAKATLNPIALQLGGRYYAEGPGGAPEWGLRFQISFLFPK